MDNSIKEEIKDLKRRALLRSQLEDPLTKIRVTWVVKVGQQLHQEVTKFSKKLSLKMKMKILTIIFLTLAASVTMAAE
jgi:hypothetical protein